MEDSRLTLTGMFSDVKARGPDMLSFDCNGFK